MATRPIRVWSGSAWEDVAIAPYDSGEFLSAATASATYIPDSIINAKGDLIVGSANDTPAILTAGSNGQMLMADSSATAGLRYVDPPANRNLIINGAMQVAQRSTSVSSISALSSAYQTNDRFATTVSNIGTWTQSVEADGPTGSGFTKSLKMLCTTAAAAPGATALMRLEQYIEGQNLQGVKKGTASAEQLTLSFWVKSNVTGTYVLEVFDVDNTRHVAATYSVSASATWERKTITLPADTSGVLGNDNGPSLAVLFWLGAGSNYTSGTLPATWASNTTANRAVGQTNLAAATNNYWQITGVQLETGPVATPFEFEPYEATLRKCQRYYQVLNRDEDFAVGQAWSTSQALAPMIFMTEMRASPTITLAGAGTTSGLMAFWTSTRAFPATVGTHIAQKITRHGFAISGSGYTSAFTAGNAAIIGCIGATDVYKADAEL